MDGTASARDAIHAGRARCRGDQLQREENGWTPTPGSAFARRITRDPPMEIAGTRARAPLMRTAVDLEGARVFGTFANCSAGKTPGERTSRPKKTSMTISPVAQLRDEAKPDPAWVEANRRFPFRENSFYGWNHQDPRHYDMRKTNEPLRFGWMVEIDPHDPPRCRASAPARDACSTRAPIALSGSTGHVAAYMGDDEKFEYIYKFVTRDRSIRKTPPRIATCSITAPCTPRASTPTARANGCRWSTTKTARSNSHAGFANQGDVVIKVRAAADLSAPRPWTGPKTSNPAPSPATSTSPAPSPRIALPEATLNGADAKWKPG